MQNTAQPKVWQDEACWEGWGDRGRGPALEHKESEESLRMREVIWLLSHLAAAAWAHSS